MRERLPNRRLSENFELEFAGTLVAVSLGYSPGGRLAEVFLSTRKIGTAVDTMARDTAILLSLALQHGATATEILSPLTRDEFGRPEGLAGVVLAEIVAR